MSYTLEQAQQDGWEGEEAEAFVSFMRKVDKRLVEICGMSSSDLADFSYAASFEAGMSDKETAKNALLANDCPRELWEDEEDE